MLTSSNISNLNNILLYEKNSFFLILFYSKIVVAQIEFSKITFKINKIDSLKYNKTKIFITQKDTIILGNLLTPIIIKKNINSLIQFENFQIKIPSIKNLKISSDTILELSSTILEDVIIKSKKNIVSESLNGFTYYPQNDSIYFDKSLFLSLQRLPFITINEQSIKYKNESKIKFLINSRERKGIGNNWESLLKNIKASDIYKVEMVEDISTLDKNQGYTVVINILTLDEHISGTSLNFALMFDQRENLNKTISFKTLQKKSDFSVDFDTRNDNMVKNKSVKTYYNANLVNLNNFKEVYTNSNYNIDVNFGYRIDSFKDIGVSISFLNWKTTNLYSNTFSSLINNNDLNILKSIKTVTNNLSYINRKNKNITKSLILGVGFDYEIVNNKIAFAKTLNYDSINNETIIKPFYWILEYNIQNTVNKKISKEFGIQIYKKQNFQDFSKYDLNEMDNQNNNSLFYKKDSFKLFQTSVRPYFGLNKTINNKKRLILNFYSEIFLTKNKNNYTKAFFLPEINFNYKKIINNKKSYRLLGSFTFNKPNIDYLSSIVLARDLLQKDIGNSFLIPEKFASISFETLQRKRATISNRFTITYGFNLINQFSEYDSASRGFLNNSNNKSNKLFFIYKLGYQLSLNKKINFSLYPAIRYSINNNNLYKTNFSGFTFSGTTDFNYFISPKLGRMQLITFLNSNNFNAQGFNQGTILYSLSYSKGIFKNKIFINLIANEFLLKNRTIKSYKYNDDFETFINNTTPFRNLAIRLSYNFSNIKVEKFEQKKTTTINGEMQRIL